MYLSDFQSIVPWVFLPFIVIPSRHVVQPFPFTVSSARRPSVIGRPSFVSTTFPVSSQCWNNQIQVPKEISLPSTILSPLLQSKKSDDDESTPVKTNGSLLPVTTGSTSSKKEGDEKSTPKANRHDNKTKQKQKRRKMELSWCGRDTCTIFEDGLREKVVGEHNEISFESPATGQVAYQWSVNDDGLREEDVILSKVLVVIKKNDDELLKAASEVSMVFFLFVSSNMTRLFHQN